MDMSWMTMELEDDHHGPFEHSQWPYYLPIQNPNEVSNSSPTHHHHLLSPLNLLGESDLKAAAAEEPEEEEPEEELGAMKEMMFKIASMQPVDIDPATIRKPRRRNVRISDDPQSVAARHRRERISEKIRILQRLVPGGTKMDTASMLEEAIRYVKFLKRQIKALQSHHHHQPPPPFLGVPTAAPGYLYGGDGGAGDDAMCFSHKFMDP